MKAHRKTVKKPFSASISQERKRLSPLVSLWMYRLLVPLGGHKEIINGYGSADHVTRVIGLDKREARHDWDAAARKAFLSKLCLEHEKMEKRPLRSHNFRILKKNLDYVSTAFGLSDAEYRILEFAILLSGEGVLYEAMALVKFSSLRDAIRGLSILLDLTEKEIRMAISPHQTLHRSGLLSVDINHRNSYSLEDAFELISSHFAQYMLSSRGNPVRLLSHLVTPAEPARLALSDYSHVLKNLSILCAYLKQAISNGKKGVNIYVHGLPGTGKTELARVLAKELKVTLFEVSTENDEREIASGKQRLKAYSAGQAILGRSGALVLFDEAEDVFNDGEMFSRSTAQNHKAWVNNLLENNPVPAIWVSNIIRGLDPAFLRRFDMVFELPNPTRQQREKIIRKSARLLDAQSVRRLAEVENLTPAVVSRAATVVDTIRDTLDEKNCSETLEFLVNCTLEAQGYRPILKNDPNRLPELYDPSLIQADVNLEEISRGILEARSARLCLYGPPGTGKTAFGRWLAEQLASPLLVRRASDLMSMWVGGTEKNIADAFRSAERENAVLLIDEVDSFLQDRRSAQRSWEVSQVNEMLTRMESFPGVFIASTNLMDNLDQASLRRFDLKVKFGFLKEEQAWQLFCRYCRHLELSAPDEVSRKRLSRLHNLTPGDFAAVVRQGRFRRIASAGELVASLEAECALKENAKAAIGFV